MISTFFRQKDTTLEFTVGSEVDVTLNVLFNVIPKCYPRISPFVFSQISPSMLPSFVSPPCHPPCHVMLGDILAQQPVNRSTKITSKKLPSSVPLSYAIMLFIKPSLKNSNRGCSHIMSANFGGCHTCVL